MSTSPTVPVAYDLPESVELVRHEIVASLAAHGRVCAAHVARNANTRDAWEMLAAECEGLGPRRSGTYGRDELARACAKMARGLVDSAVKVLADHCGMGVEGWEHDTHREMTKVVSL